MISNNQNDAYRMRRKWPYPTRCTRCDALFQNGRWTWQDHPENCSETVCPACQRITDNYPAGHIQISGNFYCSHEKELLNLIQNREKIEKKLHPMERIISIDKQDENLFITTTGVHLARRIGESLAHSFQGSLHFRYGVAENSIRVSWER
ncbi:BCAM0308 family protein [Thermodesulfobacteriota bacterium]